MILSFHPCFTADKQIILGDRKLGQDDLRLINRASAIILPQACKPDLFIACKTFSAHLFPDYNARFAFPGKIGQDLLFEKEGFPHPETRIWSSVSAFREVVSRSIPHDFPFLLKDNTNHESDGVFLVENIRGLERLLDYFEREPIRSNEFLSQEFIPASGNVLRAVILNRNIITYWKRPGAPKQEITTISRGAIIDKTWRKDLQAKGRIQAKKLSEATGINLAAVDFLFSFSDEEPLPLFLEINYYFGRRGLGGTSNYYRLLFQAIKEWLSEKGFDPALIGMV